MVERKPNGRVRVVDAGSGREAPADALSAHLIDEPVSYYQLASEAFARGDLRVDARRQALSAAVPAAST